MAYKSKSLKIQWRVLAIFNKKPLLSFLLLFVISMFVTRHAFSNTQIFNLVLENNVFTPTNIIIPANKKVKLVVENKDTTPEEFDSFDLNRERLIFAHSKATIFIGPLPTGRYEFFGEYHPNSARGVVTVEGQQP